MVTIGAQGGGLPDHDHSASGKGGALAASSIVTHNHTSGADGGNRRGTRTTGSAAITTEADIISMTPGNLPCALMVTFYAPSSVGDSATVKVTDTNNTSLTAGMGIGLDAGGTVAKVRNAALNLTQASASQNFGGFFHVLVPSGAATPIKVRASYDGLPGGTVEAEILTAFE